MLEEKNTDIGVDVAPKKKNAVVKWLLAVIVVVAVAVGVLLALPSPIDKELVKRELDKIAAGIAVASMGENQARFTYDDVVIGGGFLSKTASIKNPKLHIENGKENAGTVISTASLEVIPNGEGADAFKLVADKPFVIDKPDRRLDFTFDTKVEITNDTKLENGVSLNSQEIILPGKITVQETLKNNASASKSYFVTFTGTPILKSTSSDVLGPVSSVIDLEGISILDEDGAGFEVAKIASDFKVERHEEEKQDVSSLKAVISDLKGTKTDMSYGSVSFEADAQFAVPISGGLMDSGAWIKLSLLSLSTDKFALEISGNVTNDPASPGLPVGEVIFVVKGFDFIVSDLKAKGLINEEQEAVSARVVEALTGQPYADVKDLSVAVKHAAGESIYIGNLKAEELMALLVPPPATEEPADAAGTKEAPAAEAPSAEPAPAPVKKKVSKPAPVVAPAPAMPAPAPVAPAPVVQAPAAAPVVVEESPAAAAPVVEVPVAAPASPAMPAPVTEAPAAMPTAPASSTDTVVTP